MAAERIPDCARCGRRTELGVIIDVGYGAVTQSSWVDGAPEKSIWTGLKLKGRVRIPVITYRCPHCGYLESYAPPA